eukprot:SAG22_NODE_1320_length_4757_cov_28.614498_1_plen_152_part_00
MTTGLSPPGVGGCPAPGPGAHLAVVARHGHLLLPKPAVARDREAPVPGHRDAAAAIVLHDALWDDLNSESGWNAERMRDKQGKKTTGARPAGRTRTARGGRRVCARGRGGGAGRDVQERTILPAQFVARHRRQQQPQPGKMYILYGPAHPE